MRKGKPLDNNRAATVPRPDIRPKHSTIPWEGGSWRRADGTRCSADDPDRDYLVTRLGYEVPRLFIEEMERVEKYVREHPHWAADRPVLTSLYSWRKNQGGLESGIDSAAFTTALFKSRRCSLRVFDY